MTAALVGHSGFVGGNLLRQAHFDACYASRNIDDIVGQAFDRLVVSAVPAQMWLANSDPDRDLANILALFDRLAQVDAGQTILISTIAVYADASTSPDERMQDAYERERPYGRHRRRFEEMMAARFPNLLTVRLPALFGQGLSKNFIFDLLNPVPSFLPADRLAEALAKVAPAARALVDAAFEPDARPGLLRFRREHHASVTEVMKIAEILEPCGIAARNFTASASRFQFYNLDWLWTDISRALAAGLPMLNLATEPLSAAEIALRLTGKPFENAAAEAIVQDMRSCHSKSWGRSDGYLHGAGEVLDDLARFHDLETRRSGAR